MLSFVWTINSGKFVLRVAFIVHKITMDGISVSRLTHRAVGAHAVAALLPCQVFLIAHGAHAVGSRVAIEAATRGTEHGHRALVGLLGHR